MLHVDDHEIQRQARQQAHTVDTGDAEPHAARGLVVAYLGEDLIVCHGNKLYFRYEIEGKTSVFRYLPKNTFYKVLTICVWA